MRINPANDNARCEVREVIETVAIKGEISTITYDEVRKLCPSLCNHPHWNDYLGILLGEINLEEDEVGRGMLSSVIVSKDDKIPGKGYFNFAVSNLGRLLDVSSEGDCIEFFSNEIRRVWTEWSNME